jgi:hypothetical protein
MSSNYLKFRLCHYNVPLLKNVNLSTTYLLLGKSNRPISHILLSLVTLSSDVCPFIYLGYSVMLYQAYNVDLNLTIDAISVYSSVILFTS